MKFNLGDVVYHKATNKKCVISDIEGDKVWVTTEDNLKTMYREYELVSKKEWEDENVNAFK